MIQENYNTSQNTKRITKNTLALYIRQIITLLVSLYTVRIVLNVLGVEDYGIYNVIGGIVTLFSFLNASMASATQRFFAYALGENNLEKLKQIFSVNIIIYFLIAFFALISLETLGLWFVKNQLHISPLRLNAALYVFHFSIAAFVLSIFTAPLKAIMIAYEDMKLFAYLSIFEVVLRLAAVLSLHVIIGDKLITYAALLFFVSFLMLVIHFIVCYKKYIICRINQLLWNKKLFKEIVSFTGWTLFGQLTTVFRNQAITVLLNQFFNPVIVAARAIAVSTSNQLQTFSGNFNLSLYPPIIKSYASNNKKEMLSLIFNGSKITFFLMWVFALPLYIEMELILTLWLKNIPQHSVLFTRLSLIEVLINSLSLPIATAARAPGKMKTYELTLGSIQILIFLFAWLTLKLGGAPHSVFIIAIVANIIMFGVRLLIVRRLINLPIRSYTKLTVIPILKIISITTVFSILLHLIIGKSLIFKLLFIFTSMIFSITIMYYVGLNKTWREKIKKILISKLNSIGLNL